LTRFIFAVCFALVGCIEEGSNGEVEEHTAATDTDSTVDMADTDSAGDTADTVDTDSTVDMADTDSAGDTADTIDMADTGLNPVEVGDFYEGGVVYYLDDSGFGLIVSILDLGEADWATLFSVVPGAFDETIGGGEANTDNAVSYLGGPSGTYAVHLCYNSNEGGYDDWYLPSKDELWELMLNKELIDSVAILNGGEALTSSGFYWSSTQGTEDPRYVYGAYTEMWDMDGESVGPYASINSKNESMYVRAVRSFYVE
jgi:hypothetical protein